MSTQIFAVPGSLGDTRVHSGAVMLRVQNPDSLFNPFRVVLNIFCVASSQGMLDYSTPTSRGHPGQGTVLSGCVINSNVVLYVFLITAILRSDMHY